MAKKPQKPPLQVGDYFACTYGERRYVYIKTGPGWQDDAHVSGCATERGAQRLAALMNEAREVVRDFREIATSSPYKAQSVRDWAAHCIAAAVCEALDTPLPYFDPREEARYAILYFDRDQELAKLFEVIDAAGTPDTLDHEAARMVLLKHSGVGRRHFSEVVRAWRRTFDTTPAADRAAATMAAARA